MIDYPNEAFEYLQSNGLMEGFVTFIIDRRFRRSVYLRNWIKPQVEKGMADERVLEIVKSIPKSVSQRYDTTVIWLLRWVQRNMTYVTDQVLWDTLDYWQTYEESLDTLTGDCEDGAVLLYVLCRAAGVPANRILVVCGDVSNGRGGTEGHAWVMYRPQKDPINPVFLDWCYWFSPNDVYKRHNYVLRTDNVIVSKDKNYVKMWWCFNEIQTYLRLKPTVSK